MTAAFAERELLGRTPLAHVYLGSSAFRSGDFEAASRHFARASEELTDPGERLRARVWLARARVVAALEPERARIDPATTMLLGASYLEVGRRDEGERLLRELTERYPGEPEPVYWLARHRFLQRELSAHELRAVADGLAPHARRESLRRSLLALVDEAR